MWPLWLKCPGQLLSISRFGTGLPSLSFKPDPIFWRKNTKNRIIDDSSNPVLLLKKTRFFIFFALLPPGLVVCPRVNFSAHLSSRLAQLFSRCLSELLGMWALSTSRERPIMKANKNRENRWAHNYERELYSCNVIGRPRCLSTALNRSVPRSQLSFS